MPNMSIDRKVFVNILEQITDDIPFECEIVRKVIGNMPDGPRRQFLKELYFDFIYKGTYYRVEHYLYKEDTDIFLTREDLMKFLKEKNIIYPLDFFDTIDDRTLSTFIRKRNPLCGYIIYKEEKNVR